MYKEIKSFQNANIKLVKALREKGCRQKTGLMLVEGRREILRACEAGVHFKEIYGSSAFFSYKKDNSIFLQLRKRVKNIFRVEDNVFEKICFGHRNEGFLAVCYQPQRNYQDINLSNNPLVVVLVGLEKPGNIGAILRTCDAAGVEVVMVCDGSTDLYNPNIIRSSLGAIFSLLVIETTSKQAFSFLEKNKIKICITSLKCKAEYTNVNLNGPLALVLGSEQKGLDLNWHKKADILARVPMKGRVDSLNVSTAAAVVIYEAIRQRK